MKKPDNRMQQQQDAGGECEFVILCEKDIDVILSERTAVSEKWAEQVGDSNPPLATLLQFEAELNGHSLERSIVHFLLMQGYQLEELEVTFDKNDWGRCVWYKEHTAYNQPIPELYAGSAVNNPAFYHAMFKTEAAGDQQFGLYSTQMIFSAHPLFHKTLRYRKVVFSPPPSANDSSV